MVRIPNFIAGEWSFDGAEKPILNQEGIAVATVFSAADEQLRQAKWAMRVAAERLEQVEPSRMADLLAAMAPLYFKNPEKIRVLAELTGSGIQHLEASIQKRRTWCSNAGTYLTMAGGSPGRLGEGVKIISQPKGPLVAILPKNSDEESMYVMAQALLARVPVLIRSSSFGPTSFSAVEFLECMLEALLLPEFKDMSWLPSAFNVMNLFHAVEKDKIIDRLFVEGGVYLLFGNQKTINPIASRLAALGCADVILMGTGMAMSVVLEGADLRGILGEIYESCVFNNGTECISNRVIYADAKVADRLEAGLKDLAADRAGHSPFQLRRASLSTGIPESGGTLIWLKAFNGRAELLEGIHADLHENKIDRSIACSVYGPAAAPTPEWTLRLPAFTLRYGLGTHRFDPMQPHQGEFLLDRLLVKKLVVMDAQRQPVLAAKA